jgi:membrane associated rhomboid family serine protease
MFAVLMFGPVLEQEWGVKRYLIYYIICGVGAAVIQEVVWGLKIQSLLATYSAESVMLNYANQVVTIGASGAVFGILLAFGWLFPNVPMYLFFIPIPIKARWMVIGYAAVELFAGFSSLPGDNVAHFAHLGGMLFGLILLLWWQYKDKLKFPRFWEKWFPASHDTEKNPDYSDYHYHKRL